MHRSASECVCVHLSASECLRSRLKADYHKGLELVKDLLIHRSQEQRADQRHVDHELKKDERARASGLGDQYQFTAAQLLNDAQKAYDRHEARLLEVQESLFKCFSYLCMGIFFVW